MQKDTNIQILKFVAKNLPQPKESIERTDKTFVRNGRDNKYPNFLLDLYAGSTIHSNLINSKSTYIIGDGLGIAGKQIEMRVNEADTMADFVGKVVKDYLLFNYFCVEVVYNAMKQPIAFYHVPAQKVRWNRSKTKFAYSKDNWVTTKEDYILDRWKIKLGQDDLPTTRMFLFDGYFPSLSNVYPSPEYSASIVSIETDRLISQFNYNQIDSHFSLASLISFYNTGHLDQSIKDEYDANIENVYSGANGKKIMVEYLGPEGKAAEVKNIGANDWHKAYQELSQNIDDDIYRGHQITSPMLFGSKTAGQLGGATEFEIAYEIFKNTYIRGKRNELSAAFNMMFSNSTIVTDTVDFIDRPLFETKVSETLKEKIYTINELRAEAGKPPLPNGDKFIGQEEAKPEAPQATNTGFSKENSVTLGEEDFGQVSGLGLTRGEFEVIAESDYIFSKDEANRIELQFENADEIAKYLVENKIKNITIAELKRLIRKDLDINITVSELRNTLTTLSESGIVNIEQNDGQLTTKEVKQPEGTAPVEIMYEYVVRPGAGEPIQDNTRSFCRKMVENDRLYTRQDIQTMTSIFGYDIYQYAGGFKRLANGNVQPFCRHQWRAVTVRRRTI